MMNFDKARVVRIPKEEIPHARAANNFVSCEQYPPECGPVMGEFGMLADVDERGKITKVRWRLKT